MISKNKIKQIYALKDKKGRQKENLFVLEGIKSVKEYLNSGKSVLKALFVTEQMSEFIPKQFLNKIEIASKSEIRSMSFQSTPSGILAVFEIPKPKQVLLDTQELYLALDDIKDPGNLGTIIRTCDWFGIKHILASNSCVDVYNPKVLQASMASFARVELNYVDLKQVLSQYKGNIYGTFLEGENVFKTNLSQSGIIVIGNESNGISEQVKELITQKISIPKFVSYSEVESLNAAVASSIVISCFRAKK